MGSLLLVAASSGGSEGAPSLTVKRLRCELTVNPLGIDVRQPGLSWELESSRRAERQSAYQVIVSSTPELLKANQGDLWDSGKVLSRETVGITYQGRPLTTAERCYWAVRVWNGEGRPSAWSKGAWWEMGLLDPADWHGKWIARTRDIAELPAPLLRKAFTLTGKVKRARAYVCGLGYYELRLNGEKVGDHHLDPGYTRFDRRALYVTYDVTSQLKEGENCLGAMLGNGWLNVQTQAVWYFDKAPWRQAPKLLLELRVDYEDGRSEVVSSDESWRAGTGPILFNSIYGGETYDARRERRGWDSPGFVDDRWPNAIAVEPPGGQVTAQMCPPIRATQTLETAKLTEPKPGVWVFDLGQNFAGHARLAASGKAGTKVTLRYAERLNADGTVSQANIDEHMKKTDPPQQFQTDTYILKGEGKEVWEARFCYHGFQYVEVTGYPGRPNKDAIKGIVVHTDVEPVGAFSCSNPLLNRIWQNTLWSYLSNFESIPTDCPHREKNGWTGDAHLATEVGLLNFDGRNAYAKWLDDLDDEMRPSGELPGIVPSSGWGYAWGNGPAWDSAFLLIPWYLYEYYGDTAALRKHYPKMKRYVDYLTSKAKDGIVSLGLGDWVAPGPMPPVEVTSTGYYYVDALIVSRAAQVLGNPEDARKYSDLADAIAASWRKSFVDEGTGRVSDGGQTAQACALYQGLLTPEQKPAVLSRLLAAIEEHKGFTSCGILGAKYELNTLTDCGRTDVAYRIATQTDEPSWGNWIKHGATTLWEAWNGSGAGSGSWNHIMFGDVSAWMVKALAGINPDPDGPGFAKVIVRPHVVGDLTSAKAEYHSVRGMVTSEWRLDKGNLKLEVTLPANTTATLYLPLGSGSEVREGDGPASEAPGVKHLRDDDGTGVYELGSGTYRFAVRGFKQ
ncbi:MAG TPA: family 78 glycoside hydrolase catalytic domain [Armatimonadota bacterium]